MRPPARPVLALNAAEARLQLALGKPGKDALWREEPGKGRANSRILPLIFELLDEAGLALRDLEGVACVRGPGGFTGLRLVLSTALGLARGAGLPMAGVDSLPLVARSALARLEGDFRTFATLVVVTHACRGWVYVQAFGPKASAVSGPRALPLDNALAFCREAPGPRLVAGSGARRAEEAFAALPDTRLADPALDAPDAADLLRHCGPLAFGPQAVEPLYLRGSDAEENLPRIAAAQGLDPRAARQSFSDLTSFSR